MKIVSKFEDYYDVYQFQLGEDVYYDRNMNLRYVEKNEWNNFIVKDSELIRECNDFFRKYLPNNYCMSYKADEQEALSYDICFVGEKIIPFITIYNSKYLPDATSFKFIHSIEEWNLYLESKQNYISSKLLSYVNEHFAKSHIDLYNAIRNITKVPIVSYSSYRNNKSDYIKMSESTMLNPCLKDLGFSKILEPNIVIQELELYINKINLQEKNIEFSNDLKITNAGFDKNSFKKGINN